MKLVRFRNPDVWNWSGFDQFFSLRDEINKLFETPQANGTSSVLNTWAPALDLYETKDNLVLTAELPGMEKKDLHLSIHENTITISGERQKKDVYEDGETSREERFFGRFTRSLVLPKPVESSNAKATYRDGILIVTLPKAAAAKPVQIEVSVK